VLPDNYEFFKKIWIDTFFSAWTAPDSIPNSLVKPCRADDTAWVHRLEACATIEMMVGSAHPTGKEGRRRI